MLNDLIFMCHNETAKKKVHTTRPVLLTDIKNLKIIMKVIIVPNLKLLDECLGLSLDLGRLPFCKADGGRELLAPLWRIFLSEVLWGSEYSSI